MSRRGRSGKGPSRLSRRGGAWTDTARKGQVRLGQECQGRHGPAEHGGVRLGTDLQIMAGVARIGKSRPGLFGTGKDKQGDAGAEGKATARRCMGGKGCQCMSMFHVWRNVKPPTILQGSAGLGKAGHRSAWQSNDGVPGKPTHVGILEILK